jgi:putative transposase
MANTYTQLHIQFVFAVKYRQELIQPSWKERLQQYMTGIIQNNGHKLLQINNMPDHMHILVGFRPKQAISAFVQNLKAESTKWIRSQKLSPLFEWQEGYGAFSYSKSHVPAVVRYIQEQERHHRKRTFLDEYRRMLSAFDIEYNEQYIFKEPM